MKIRRKAFLLVLGVTIIFAAMATIPTVVYACKAGDKAEVLWKGKWYPASVLKTKGDQCFIHYDGYGSSWDEWVGPNRIKINGSSAAADQGFQVGDAVKVQWKSSWYDARVIAAKAGSWKIHYDGYSDSWDEWVDASRIKKK